MSDYATSVLAGRVRKAPPVVKLACGLLFGSGPDAGSSRDRPAQPSGGGPGGEDVAVMPRRALREQMMRHVPSRRRT